MNTLPLSQLANASPLDQAKLPADVRKAGPKAEQLYKSALGFEQLLLQQLASALSSTANMDGSTDDSGDDSGGDDSGSSIGSDSSTSSMLQMLPDAFAQSLTSSGGVGIARQLYDSMKAGAGIATPETSK